MFDGELVILDLARGEYLALDRIGAALWTGLEAGKALAEIAESVVREYDVTLETAAADLESLVSELVEKGLFVESES
jgi:hypothetical protein